MELNRLCPLFLRGGCRFVGHKQYFGLQERSIAIDLQHFKPFVSFTNQIHAAVGILLGHSDYLGGASDVRDAFFESANDAERRAVRQAFPNHFFVSRLKNVKGQWSAREQYQFQRKQRKKSQAISEFNPSILRQHLAHLDLLPLSEYNPSMELAGKVVVVTGASMGIGEAIAKVFVEAGASVVLLSRDAARAEAARVRIGSAERTAAFSCDVRHSEEIDRVLALTLHHFHRIDVWINNAGHGLLGSVPHMDMSACHDMFETNFFGAVSAMQKVIPVMRQQGGGTIINISSVAGHIPLPFHAAYSATKFALNAIGKAARVELKKDGIHVLTVCPGYVATAFGQNAVRGNELKTVRPASVRGIPAERVARATLQGYLKGKREVIVPWTMHIPVKLYQLFPGLVEWAMSRMAK